jgi:hypothetical protein
MTPSLKQGKRSASFSHSENKYEIVEPGKIMLSVWRSLFDLIRRVSKRNSGIVRGLLSIGLFLQEG